MAFAWSRRRSRRAQAGINMCLYIPRARAACCSSWWNPGNHDDEAQKREAEKEIVEIVNRETRAWDTKDVDLLITVFHPDMVWPWPPSAGAHDPVDWVLMLGRFDAHRWKKYGRSCLIPTTLSTIDGEQSELRFPSKAMAPSQWSTLILCGATGMAKTSTGKGGRARSTAEWARSGK